jgi:formamidopyrimidine-DNA glycosylase
MPELPEVETVRQTLIPLVVGKTIQDVSVFWPNIVKRPDVPAFIQQLKGQTIREIGRRGKFLKFIFDDVVLVSHLRMEGRYLYEQKGAPRDAHTHIIFSFTDETELRYRDVRKFGTMHLFKKGEEEGERPLAQLGPEPFSHTLTIERLKQRLQKTNRKMKVVLLDQTVIAGLGNIYVDEVLFRSGIHPERQAHQLTDVEIAKLHTEIISTLQEAIEKGGSTIRTYVNTQGKKGTFQTELYVYGRKNEPCKRCGEPIQKITVAGRGTHYCRKCQL